MKNLRSLPLARIAACLFAFVFVADAALAHAVVDRHLNYLEPCQPSADGRGPACSPVSGLTCDSVRRLCVCEDFYEYDAETEACVYALNSDVDVEIENPQEDGESPPTTDTTVTTPDDEVSDEPEITSTSEEPTTSTTTTTTTTTPTTTTGTTPTTTTTTPTTTTTAKTTTTTARTTTTTEAPSTTECPDCSGAMTVVSSVLVPVLGLLQLACYINGGSRIIS